MCGRFVSTLPPEGLLTVLSAMLGSGTNLEPNWNVAPTQGVPVARRHPETGQRQLDVLKWGLVPHFTKDLKAARKPINARSETVANSVMFRGALASKRCLVPADAFYEWKAMPDGKQPYAFARRDETPLVFAGIWEGWKAPDGDVLRTFTILTTEANETMRWLHERMPVVLEPSDWPLWLGEIDGDHTALMRPAGDDVLTMWPVSRAVNSVRNNGPALLDRIDDPAAPPPSNAPSGANPASDTMAERQTHTAGGISGAIP